MNGKPVRFARTSAAALAEQYQGELQTTGQFQQAVLLFVVHPALRAGEDGKVVCHHHAARALRAERRAVHSSNARDETVRRAIPDEFVHGAALTLRRHVERAIFGKAARVAQVCDVLSCGPLVSGAPPRYRVRTSLVEADAMAFDGGGEVRPNDIEVARGFHRIGLGMTVSPGSM